MTRAFLAGHVTSTPRTSIGENGDLQIGFYISHTAGDLHTSTYIVCRAQIATYVHDTHLLDGQPHILVSGCIETSRDGIQLTVEHIARDAYPSWQNTPSSTHDTRDIL